MRYGTFKYGTGVLYGATATAELPSLLWAIEVDWDGDGYFSGENEAPRASGFNLQRGRRSIISGQRLAHYQPGKCFITLDNADGRYDYFNTSSPIYPNVKPGKFARIRVRDVANATTYSVMFGQITEIFPFRVGGVKKCRLTIEDGLRWLANQIIKTNLIVTNQYDNLVWNTILPEAAWPTTYWAILGNRTTKVINWWWAWDRNALEAINDLEDCTAGVFVHTRLGRAEFFGGNDTFISATIDLDESECLRDISINQPWDIIRNEVVVKLHKKYSIANTDILWQLPLDQDVRIPNGANELFEVKLAPDPGLSGADSFETAAQVIVYDNPTAFFDDFSHTQDDTEGAGGFMNSGYTLQIHKQSSGVIFSVDNPSGIDQFFHGDIAPSDVVNMVEPIFITSSDTASQAEYGKRTLSIDVRDIENSIYARELADYYLAKFKDPAVYPVVQIENRPAKQFQPDLWQYRFNFTAPSVGISSAQLFRIGGIEHNWLNENGNSVRTTFWLEPYTSLFSFTA